MKLLNFLVKVDIAGSYLFTKDEKNLKDEKTVQILDCCLVISDGLFSFLV